MMPKLVEISAYVAEYHGTNGSLMLFGFGPTELEARQEALNQILRYARAGAFTTKEQQAWRSRIHIRAVGPDEASELCEWIATPGRAFYD